MAQYRKPVSEKLDKLYNTKIRCPYCKSVIPKYIAKCPRCGITKTQIAEASNLKAKEVKLKKTGEKILMTKTKPDDISFTKMILFLLIGMFGAHNFFTGRKIRGGIILGMMITFIAFCFIIPISSPEEGIMGMHEWRKAFDGGIFPTDALGVAAVAIWIYDFFGVVFGYYKYPVKI